MSQSEVFDSKYASLNKRQKEAVDAIYGPVMVVAGPGTGKTTMLTLRIANILLKTDARPEEILALTFTDSGARAMREKLRELIGDTSFRVNIFTFHSFANHMRSLYPENFRKIGERMPASDAERLEIIENILAKESFKELRISIYGVSVSKVAGRLSDLKRELVSAEKLRALVEGEREDLALYAEGIEKKTKTAQSEIERKEKHLKRIEELSCLYDLYEKELEKRSLYDYDDAILEFLSALEENPDMQAEMRESFQFILADEHQDANGAQNAILRMFKGDDLEPPNIFVVGDDKQSIFRFQGASLEHFYNFSKEFPGAKKISLEENYRSQKLILEGSHSLISSDGRDHARLQSTVSHEEKEIEIVEYPDFETELAAIAEEVKKIPETETVAVISRNNSTLFSIAPYLEAKGIKFSIAGERSLFEDFEYRRLFSLLDALSNPFDGRLLQALYMGYFNLETSDLLALSGEARKKRQDFSTLFLEGGYELKLSNEKAFESVRKQVKKLLNDAKTLPVTDFLRNIKDEIYYGAKGEAYDALRSVFGEASSLILKKRSATLDDLVRHLSFLEKHNLAPLTSEKKRSVPVELLSIHRSKGLEFDYVFIIDVTEKRFEGSGKRGDLLKIPGIGVENELEEERRLLYVALTRARKHVSVSYSLSGEKGENSSPTSLLDEIDKKFVAKKVFSGEIEKPDLLSLGKRKERRIEALRDAFLERSFSVTALNNFLECPWKYLVRNLLLIPDVAEFSANLGNASHNALRNFHLSARKGKIMNEDEMRKNVHIAVYGQSFTEGEIHLALSKVQEYMESYAKGFVPFAEDEKAYIEEAFSFKYRVSDGDDSFEIPITGKIDLAREVNGTVKVIDFKTKKRMSRNDILGETKSGTGNEMRQLEFYKFLIENSRSELSVSLGALTFLVPEGGVTPSEVFELTQEHKKEIEDILKKILLSIYRFDFLDRSCGEKTCECCALRSILNI